MNLSLLVLFSINIIFKAFFLNHSPNSYSLEEIDLIRKINLHPPMNDFSIRYLSIGASILISFISYLLIYKATKNIFLGLFFGLVLSLSPWIIIISRFVNVYILFLLIVALMNYFLPQRKVAFFINIFLIVLFKIFFNSTQLPNFNQLSNGVDNLFKLLDFRNLFFNGDPLSPSLRIPKTGFFLYFDLLALFAGFYYLYIINKKRQISKITIYLFFLGLIYFFLLPDLNYTFRGILIFYSLSLIVACGYYFIFISLIGKKKIASLFISIIVLINLAFYQELFYFHFDKKTSYDWGYAETTTIKYLTKQKYIKKIYLTSESGKLQRYLSFFDNTHRQIEIIPPNKLSEICYKGKPYICILREHELQILSLEKDMVKTKFSHFDGLPMYFLIAKEK